MTAITSSAPDGEHHEWKRIADATVALLMVATPLAVGFYCTVRALFEFAYGGPIYGVGGHPWAVGEWMISYASGFVRRGLSGEIMIPLAQTLGGPALPYLIVTIACALLVSAVLLWRYAPHGRTEAVLMLFLPTSVLFPLWDYNVVGRKEQLILALCAMLAMRCRKDNVPGERVAGSLGIGLVAAGLMLLHEGLVFFMPLLFALLEIRRPPGTARETLVRFVAMVGPSTAAFLAITAASSPIDTEPLFRVIPEYGPGMEAWCKSRGIGSICWLGFPTTFIVGYVYNIGFAGFMKAFGLVMLEAAAVTAMYLRVRGKPIDPRTAWLLALGWLGVAPLYFVAFDWGRWDATVAMMFALMVPIGLPPRRRPVVVLLGAAAVMSMFTVSHLQSQSFEIGGPLLLHSGVEAAAGWLAP